jgi:hypothetical protein
VGFFVPQDLHAGLRAAAFVPAGTGRGAAGGGLHALDLLGVEELGGGAPFAVEADVAVVHGGDLDDDLFVGVDDAYAQLAVGALLDPAGGRGEIHVFVAFAGVLVVGFCVGAGRQDAGDPALRVAADEALAKAGDAGDAVSAEGGDFVVDPHGEIVGEGRGGQEDAEEYGEDGLLHGGLGENEKKPDR